MHRDRKTPVRALAAALALVTLAGCDALTGAGSDECRSTSEFGSTGCAEVRGVVVDRAGAPQPRIIVTPGFLPHTFGFDAPSSTTDREGRFRFRVTRYFSDRPATGPDTMSLYARAVDPATAGVGIPATVRDSVLVRVTIADVGAVPTPTDVTITLSRD